MRYSYAGWNLRTAKRLYDMGYITLPAHGKRLLIPGWETAGHRRYSWRDLACVAEKVNTLTGRTWAESGCNISHVFGNASDMVGVDIDILNPKVSERIQKIAVKIFGDTPFVRIGRWPKVAMYYRKSGTGHRSSKNPGLEIFSSSGQMVWFGVHPGTNKPYVWPRKSPLSAESTCLPSINPAQIKQFLQVCLPIAAEVHGGVGREEKAIVPKSDMKAERSGKIGKEYRDVLLRQLAVMDPAKGNRHYIVVSVIGSMMHRGYSCNEIHKFLDGPYVKRFESLDRTDRHRKIDRIIRGFNRKMGRRNGQYTRV